MRVGAPNLRTVRFANGGTVEPDSRFGNILVGIVDGIQNTVGADFEHHVRQRLCAKVAAGGDVKAIAQILAQGQLGFRGEPTALTNDGQRAKY